MNVFYTHQQFLDDIMKTFPEVTDFPDILNFTEPNDPLRERFRFKQLLSEFVFAMIRQNNWSKEQLAEMFGAVLDEYREQCIIFPVDKEPTPNSVNVYVSDVLDKEFKHSLVFKNAAHLSQSDLSGMLAEVGVPRPKYIMVLDHDYTPSLYQEGGFTQTVHD